MAVHSNVLLFPDSYRDFNVPLFCIRILYHTWFILLILSLSNPAQAGMDALRLLRSSGMQFVENRGQIMDTEGQTRQDILFAAKDGNTSIYLRKGGISYVMISGTETNLSEKQPSGMQRVDMEFLGCDKQTKIKMESPDEGYFNYYLSHCSEGITRVNAYKKITYQSVYPDIDVSFYGKQSISGAGMKYDFIVSPGGNPDDIQLKYIGADDLALTSEGKLVIKTKIGEIKEWIPSTYQYINGKRIPVISRYELQNAAVRIRVGSYDKTQPLIIDPWVTWITYYGGNGDDYGNGITTDGAGNVIVAGATASSNFPVLSGYQMSNAGGSDAFVVKFDAAGGRQWATYYGGTDNDGANSVDTDAGGNILIAGTTSSVDFPVLSGFQMSNAGGLDDAFVIQLDGAGFRRWATYYGGTNSDNATGVAADGIGNVFIAGKTNSIDFPTFSGFQMGYKFNSDAFVVKFNSSGARQWATYYGGTGSDGAMGITANNTGNAFVVGNTNSSNFPVWLGFQMAHAGGFDDAFIIKFTPTGLVNWATYYGGSGADLGNAIATDGSGNVFITGGTGSADFPLFSPFQAGFAGLQDVYAVKFNAFGTPQWATYYGGAANDYGNGIAVDAAGNSYITGDTHGPDFPVTGGVCQSAFAGVEDNFLLSFDSSGSRLCATYIGGSDQDQAAGIAYFGSYVYITGNTAGSYPVTTGSFQTVYGGGTKDAFVAQLPKNCNCSSSIAVTASVVATCAGQCTGTASVTPWGGASPYSYLWNNGQTTSTVTGLCGGGYTVTIADADNLTATVTVTVIANTPPLINVPPDQTITPGQSVMLGVSGGGTYSWDNGETGSAVTVSPMVTTVYCVTVSDSNGCTNTACVTVEIIDCASGIYLPNAFSPNKDGENDVLKVYYPDISCIRSFKLAVCDRWGETVFSTDNPAFAWDGSYSFRIFGKTGKEKPMHTSVLAYYLDAVLITDEHIMRKGNISLIR